MAQTLSALMGNTVMRYSITIGVYLASLGVGAIFFEKGDEKDYARRLIRIEIWLSIIGGLAVLTICSFDIFHRFLGNTASFFSAGLGQQILPVLFFVLCNTVIVLVGILSGHEIPLLIALSEAKKPNTMNRVLGIDYFGSLLGAALFPVVLLPKLGLFALSYLTGLLNAFACILLLIFNPVTGKFRHIKITGTVTIGLLLLLTFTGNTQRFFLKKFYYYQDITSFSALFDSFKRHPEIEEFRSPYQHIHIVNAPDGSLQRLIYDQYSNKFIKEPNFPQDMWLFLNNKYQFTSNVEEFYHEFFVHVPIQWMQPPEEVLVLGAGDGIVVRELLKYKNIKRIKIVDLDPQMLYLARHHPFLQKVNHRSLEDPRVTVIVDDAFSWLQRCDQKFSAIYIDFPDPNTYDLAKLYSLEFYSLVRHCVSEDGFVAADLPAGESDLWDEYYSTLRAAGFQHIKPFDNLVEDVNDGVLKLEKQFVGEETEEKGVFRQLVTSTMEDLQHRFVFLQPKERSIRPHFN
jgi:spermidine synthase